MLLFNHPLILSQWINTALTTCAVQGTTSHWRMSTTHHAVLQSTFDLVPMNKYSIDSTCSPRHHVTLLHKHYLPCCSPISQSNNHKSSAARFMAEKAWHLSTSGTLKAPTLALDIDINWFLVTWISNTIHLDLGWNVDYVGNWLLIIWFWHLI